MEQNNNQEIVSESINEVLDNASDKVENSTIQAGNTAMAEKIYALIVKRNIFYRDNLRFLLILMLFGVLTLVFLLVSIAYMSIAQKTAWYIPANLNGTVIKTENIQTTESDGINITDDKVIAWVQEAIPTVYNFNFLSSEANFRNMVSVFTSEGYRAYKYALETQSGTLATVNAASAAVQGSGCGSHTVKIIKKGVEPVQGYPVYVWRLEMPMVVRNSNNKRSQVLAGTLEARIQRVPKLVAKSGLAIYSFVFYNAKAYDGDADFPILCKGV
jgi:hypothetical protein